MADLDFPPPPASPTLGQTFSGPRGVTWLWDGNKWTAGGSAAGVSGVGEDAPADGQVYGRENHAWSPVLSIVGGQMQGEILLLPGIPASPHAAASREYVDEIAAAQGLYQGIWQVGTNSPDISMGAAIDATEYLAVTANPTVPEMAPTNIPGIGGKMIHNGDRVIWASPLHIWQQFVGDALDLQIGDARYLQLVGGVMTGAEYFSLGVPLNFYDSAGFSATMQVRPDNTFAMTATGAGGAQRPLLSMPMRSDTSALTISPPTQFSGSVTLASDPVALLQAATKRYVDNRLAAVSGGLNYIATINGSTGQCVFTAASGFPSPGPLPAASLAPNMFVICDTPGVVPSGPIAGMSLAPGDWVLSDGNFWNHIAIGNAGLIASSVHVTPPILGAVDVQAALLTLSTRFLPLTGGTLSGPLNIVSPNNLTVGYSAAPANVGPSQILTRYCDSGAYSINAYVNNASPNQWAYLANGNAAVIALDGSGNLVFYTAPAGTAGNQAAFSNYLYIAPSGPVNVGGGANIANPLSINMGPGGYANILMTVAGVRQWSSGVYNDGNYYIVDNTAGAARVLIGLDGVVNLYSAGVRYQNFNNANAFAFTWDGSFMHPIVNNTDVGQLATVGYSNGRYLLRTGDSSPNGYTFGYVASSSDINAAGSIGAAGSVSAGGVVYSNNGQVNLVAYGVQYADWGSHLYSQSWDGNQIGFIVDNAVSQTYVTQQTSHSVHTMGMTGGILFWLDAGGALWAVSASVSDRSVKDNILPTKDFDSLAAISAIPTWSFDRTDIDTHVPFGFIGQEVAEHMPDGIFMTPEVEGQPAKYALDTNNMLCHAYRAIKQLNDRLAKLENAKG